MICNVEFEELISVLMALIVVCTPLLLSLSINCVISLRSRFRQRQIVVLATSSKLKIPAYLKAFKGHEVYSMKMEGDWEIQAKPWETEDVTVQKVVLAYTLFLARRVTSSAYMVIEDTALMLKGAGGWPGINIKNVRYNSFQVVNQFVRSTGINELQIVVTVGVVDVQKGMYTLLSAVDKGRWIVGKFHDNGSFNPYVWMEEQQCMLSYIGQIPARQRVAQMAVNAVTDPLSLTWQAVPMNGPSITKLDRLLFLPT